MTVECLTKQEVDAAFAKHRREQRLFEWRRTTAAERVRIAGNMIRPFLPQIERVRELQAAAGIDHNGRKVDADGWPVS